MASLRLDGVRLANSFVSTQREEAIALVSRAIRSGIFNDLGSGSNVDVCVITKDQTEMLRNYEMPVCRVSFLTFSTWNQGAYAFSGGIERTRQQDPRIQVPPRHDGIHARADQESRRQGGSQDPSAFTSGDNGDGRCMILGMEWADGEAVGDDRARSRPEIRLY